MAEEAAAAVAEMGAGGAVEVDAAVVAEAAAPAGSWSEAAGAGEGDGGAVIPMAPRAAMSALESSSSSLGAAVAAPVITQWAVLSEHSPLSDIHYF